VGCGGLAETKNDLEKGKKKMQGEYFHREEGEINTWPGRKTGTGDRAKHFRGPLST